MIRIKFVIFTILALFPALVKSQSRLTYISAKYSSEQIDSLRQVISQKQDPDRTAAAYSALIYAYKKINPVLATAVGQEALQFAKEKAGSRGVAEVLTELGKVYDSNHESDKALYAFENALTIYNKLQDLSGQGIILDFIGQSYFDAGNYPSALKYFLKSLEVFKNVNDPERISIVQNDLGIVNTFIGNYEVALTYYFSALKLKEGRAPNSSLSNTLANIGDVYNNLQNYSTAEKYFSRALTKANNPQSKMVLQTKMAGVIAELNRVSEAKTYINQALSGFLQLGNNSLIAFAYMNLGKVFLKAAQPDSAYITFEKALHLYQTYGGRNGVVEATNQLGYILILKGKHPQAIDMLLAVLPLADSLHIKDKLRETNEYLSLAYEKKGAFETALYFRKRSNELKDSINSGQKTAIISAAQLQYETENKNKEIELLTKENEYARQLRNFWIIIALLFVGVALLVYARYYQKKRTYQVLEQKNEEIRVKNEILQKTTSELGELVATKDKFFSIIAHDLKNPFNTILLISSVFNDDTEQYSEEDFRKMGKNLHKTAFNAYKLLENLLEWSRMQIGKVEFKPSGFSVSDVVKVLVESLEATARTKNITIDYNSETEHFMFADKNMIELILRNLITNAIKFSFPNGKIGILIEKESYQYNIHVKDSGVGISADNQLRLFHIDGNVSSRGTADESGTGLGLILCKEMAEKHKGSISVASEKNKGSIFTLTIPQ
ncbi:MAG: tetratricopeptide repeat-containing sensor histidine kinase [Ignavibacteriales bacterium]|nr:tetratricopeptide repeat-containing sensor histidine kinase [Ignavibacteriales bacterium]